MPYEMQYAIYIHIQYTLYNGIIKYAMRCLIMWYIDPPKHTNTAKSVPTPRKLQAPGRVLASKLKTQPPMRLDLSGPVRRAGPPPELRGPFSQAQLMGRSKNIWLTRLVSLVGFHVGHLCTAIGRVWDLLLDISGKYRPSQQPWANAMGFNPSMTAQKQLGSLEKCQTPMW